MELSNSNQIDSKLIDCIHSQMIFHQYISIKYQIQQLKTVLMQEQNTNIIIIHSTTTSHNGISNLSIQHNNSSSTSSNKLHHVLSHDINYAEIHQNSSLMHEDLMEERQEYGEQEMKDEEQENIDLEESQQMDEEQQILFMKLQQSKSNDSNLGLGKLLPQHNQMYDRPSLIWEIPNNNTLPNIFVNRKANGNNNNQHGDNQNQHEQPALDDGLKIFKKIKKTKIKNKCDYEKNICGYITKKIIRQFIGKTYQKLIMLLCIKHHSNYKECRNYYQNKIQYVTGPSHLPELLAPFPSDSTEIIAIKRIFREFYGWFLKERYLRYLIIEGKMTNKSAYILYKNNYLFRFVSDADSEQREMMMVQHLKMKSRSKSKVRVLHDNSQV